MTAPAQAVRADVEAAGNRMRQFVIALRGKRPATTLISEGGGRLLLADDLDAILAADKAPVEVEDEAVQPVAGVEERAKAAFGSEAAWNQLSNGGRKRQIAAMRAADALQPPAAQPGPAQGGEVLTRAVGLGLLIANMLDAHEVNTGEELEADDDALRNAWVAELNALQEAHLTPTEQPTGGAGDLVAGEVDLRGALEELLPIAQKWVSGQGWREQEALTRAEYALKRASARLSQGRIEEPAAGGDWSVVGPEMVKALEELGRWINHRVPAGTYAATTMAIKVRRILALAQPLQQDGSAPSSERGWAVSAREEIARAVNLPRLDDRVVAVEAILSAHPTQDEARLREALEKIAAQYVPAQTAEVDLLQCQRIARAALTSSKSGNTALPVGRGAGGAGSGEEMMERLIEGLDWVSPQLDGPLSVAGDAGSYEIRLIDRPLPAPAANSTPQEGASHEQS